MRRLVLTVVLLLWVAPQPGAQGTPPATPLVLLTAEGRRPVPTTLSGGQELIALSDVAALFQVTVRDDTVGGGVTVTFGRRTIVVSPNQSIVSVDGQLVALPSPPVRAGQRWLVPIEFLPRALGPIYDRPIDLRRAARLLIVGDVPVPRVTARVESAGPPTRAIVEVSPPAVVTAAGDATRVVLRIEGDLLDLALPAAGGGLIRQIRAGDQPNTVALLLAPGAGDASWGTSTTGDVTRVTIEIAAAGAAPPSAAVPPAPLPPALEPTPAAPPIVLTRPRSPIETIVIDPGHGGEDVGARGPGGTLEKDLTLAVAQHLRSLIETQLGIRVVLTRGDDRAVGLDERAAVANNSKADLFLSLHANAALSPSIGGAEVFSVQLDREGEAARRAAAADAVALPGLDGRMRVIDVVRWDLAQAPHVDTSAVLAALVEEELRQRVSLGPRSRQRAPLRVLTGANMPAALIEMAYLTNPDEERRMASSDYQARIAQAVYTAIVRFRAYLEERQRG